MAPVVMWRKRKTPPLILVWSEQCLGFRYFLVAINAEHCDSDGKLAGAGENIKDRGYLHTSVIFLKDSVALKS